MGTRVQKLSNFNFIFSRDMRSTIFIKNTITIYSWELTVSHHTHFFP